MDQRMNIAVARQTETGLPLIYVNQVGGQDELVFDGGSFVLDRGQPDQMPDADVPRGDRDHALAARQRGLGLRSRDHPPEAPRWRRYTRR